MWPLRIFFLSFSRSYEAGVLLLPRFVTNQTHFDLDGDKFILPYDLPVSRYEDSDWPFFYDLLLAR